MEIVRKTTSPAVLNLSKPAALYFLKKEGGIKLLERVSREVYFIAEETALTNPLLKLINKRVPEIRSHEWCLSFHTLAVAGKELAENRGG